MDTTLASDIALGGKDAKYDRVCKKLLAYKSVLAWIMKECVEEYKGLPIAAIEQYIEGTPDVGSIPVRPDQTNSDDSSLRIDSTGTEDNTINEGTVFYDIRFEATVPGTDEPIGLIINVEAQNKFNTPYPLTKREIYYCARLLSAQYGKVFEHAQYGKLKKVYSIWICTNVPERMKNSVVQIRLTAENIIGDSAKYIDDYDLMRTVQINLSDDTDTKHKILRLFDVLFSKILSAEDKKKVLSEEFGIPMTSSFTEGVNEMCNLSQGVIEYGMTKGLAEGIAQGKAEGIGIGIEKGIYVSLCKLMKSMNITFDKAAELLDISEDDKEKYKKMLES